jgi:N-acylneuraminate cytidylyltransferase
VAVREVLAIIPARGGSKSIPKKNLALVAGKALIAWSIQSAHMSRFVHRVVVSTDDAEIKKTALFYGAEVIDRPAELATDEALTDPVMIHVLRDLRRREDYRPNFTVLLQPTSPVRPVGLIDECIMTLVERGASSLFTGFYGPHFIWYRAQGWPSDPLKRPGFMRPMNFPLHSRKRRQDMRFEERPFFENGCVYVTDAEKLIETENRVCPPTEAFEMAISQSLDIDTEEQLREAETVLFPGYNSPESAAVTHG